MSKIAVFIHIPSLYSEAMHHLSGKIDYAKYIDFLRPVGELVLIKFYTHKTTPAGFIKALRFAELGEIVTCSDEISFAVDVIETCFGDTPIDKVILGTGDPTHIPIIKYLQKGNMPVIVCAPRPSLMFSCDTMSIGPSMLHHKTDRGYHA